MHLYVVMERKGSRRANELAEMRAEDRTYMDGRLVMLGSVTQYWSSLSLARGCGR